MRHFIMKSLEQTLTGFSEMVAEFLPRLLAMIIIIVMGWVAAWLIKVILRRVLALIRFNSLFATAGFTQLLARATLPSPSELVARLVFWLVWLTFILFGLSALQIATLQEEISHFIHLLPQILVALGILLVGILIANFVSRAALLAAVNADSPSPRLISAGVRFVIIALAVTMSLERVGLGRGVVLVAFSTFFGAIMLGLALAFGLGGRDLARRVLERRFPEEKKEEDQGVSHL
ncbi:MAG: mechanosensitive ion channel family protein [Terriglobia bacterium]